MGTGSVVDDPLGMLRHITDQSAAAVEEVRISIFRFFSFLLFLLTGF